MIGNLPFNLNQLKSFLTKAGAATYVGGGAYEKIPERSGFYELVYAEGEWQYRDSYTGFYRSRGTETIRFQNKPVWVSLYGGGMVDDKKSLADQTFQFLKQAMNAKPKDFYSARGPENFKEDKWEYRYQQEGDIDEFSGNEEIYFQGKKVFFHHIIGGIVVDKI